MQFWPLQVVLHLTTITEPQISCSPPKSIFGNLSTGCATDFRVSPSAPAESLLKDPWPLGHTDRWSHLVLLRWSIARSFCADTQMSLAHCLKFHHQIRFPRPRALLLPYMVLCWQTPCQRPSNTLRLMTEACPPSFTPRES